MGKEINDNFIIKEFFTDDTHLNTNKIRLSWLKNHKDIKDYLDNRFPELKNLKISYSAIVHFIKLGKVHKCKTCGKVIEDIRRTYCSSKCRAQDKDYWKTFNKSMELKYGGKWAMQCENIKQKFSKSIQDKYGSDWFVETNEFKQKADKKRKETFEKKYGKGITCAFSAKDVREKMKNTCLSKYGIEYPCLLPQCTNGHNKTDSSVNKNFQKLLEKYNIPFEREFGLTNKAYDFKINDILIELDPYATHNINWTPFSNKKGIDKNYHLDKTNLAIENGYRCIHIFDWVDPEKVITELLLEKPKIGARQCQVKLVDKELRQEFINIHHLQNDTKFKKDDINIGLFYKDELVSIMTFGKPRYNKKYQWELLRYCSSYAISGGSNKLFKYFIDNYEPKSIISYCDNSLFNGNVYRKLGFNLLNERVIPSCHWVNRQGNHITDNLLRQYGADKLLGTKYGKGTDNNQIMLDNGYVQVFDCGQLTFIWGNNKQGIVLEQE